MAWGNKPRKVNVIVDNDSWVIPYAKALVEKLNAAGDKAVFESDYAKVAEADASFYLGCVKITPADVLVKSAKNLVVHASNLPKGRGFSPMTYYILEGKSELPVCLLEMADDVDAGPVVFKELLKFNGTELIEELRQKLGDKQVELCFKYMQQAEIPKAEPQQGEASYYKRRRPEDSKVETSKTLDEIFNNLRVADNERYPVYFEKDGQTYILKIEKK